MMIDIACNDRKPLAIKEISHIEGISIKYLEQLARTLLDAGLLCSVRGKYGGYLLSRSAEQITAGDILRAAEGTTAPVACLEEGAIDCPRKGMCSTIDFWVGLDNAIREYIDNVSLESLVNSKPCI